MSWFALSLFVAACGVPVLAADRPNIVLIMTDDQGAWSLGCYGNPDAHTPTIDRLAAQGVRMTKAFATIPVCSPSRATYYTGRIPSQHGVHDWIKHENDGERARYCIPNEMLLSYLLQKCGYTCGLSGKWHLGDNKAMPFSYDFWFVLPSGGSKYQDAPMYWEGKKVETKGYLTDRITDKAIEFLDLHGDKQFFLNVQYNAPHSPYDGHPQELLNLFKDCSFGQHPRLPDHPWKSTAFGIMKNNKALTAYYAMCAGVDRGVARILKTLDERGLTDNTLVIYTSDQGYCCGHHGLWGKGNASNPRNMYDTSMHVPMIIRHPGKLPAGRTTDAMFSAYDFLPTVLDYVGGHIPENRNLAGRSFVAALKGEPFEAPEAVFGEYGRARSIRTNQFKYIHRADGGPDELYDIVKDPDEANNLYSDPAYRARMFELRDRLFKWFVRYAEAGTDPVGNEYLPPKDRKLKP